MRMAVPGAGQDGILGLLQGRVQMAVIATTRDQTKCVPPFNCTVCPVMYSSPTTIGASVSSSTPAPPRGRSRATRQ
jgi:hypothetical protein